MIKHVTFKEAAASGKRFRYAGPLPPLGHRAQTGHTWYLPSDMLPAAEGLRRDIAAKCAHCLKEPFSLTQKDLDAWIVERDEDKLMSDAERILSSLGLRIAEPQKVD